MNIRTSVLTLAVLFVTASTLLADWPQWRGPQRSGYVPAEGVVTKLPAAGISALWKFDSFAGGDSGGWSSPVISGNRVFAYSHSKIKVPGAEEIESKFPWLPPEKRTGMTDAEYEQYEINRRDENERQAKAFRFEERLVCLDLTSGDLVWDRKLDSKYTRFTQSGTPCVADGRVYVLGAERTARCYDAATGEVIWNSRIPGDFRDEFFASSFIVDGDVALIACGPLFALNTKDGSELWRGDEPLDYQSHSSPAVWHTPSGSVAIINSDGGITCAYQIADGKKLWELETGVGQSSPLVSGDLLLSYGSSRKNGLSCFRLNANVPSKEPELAWRFQGAADSGSCPVVRDDAVFVQGEKRLAKVRLSDGEAVWQTTLNISSPKYTSLIAAGDQILYGWEGLLSVRADGELFEQIYDAKVDCEGRLIAADDLREKLKLNELAKQADGQAESEELWYRNTVQSGPLACTTPAFTDGRIVLRLNDAVVCFDLRL
jgi:outer membrane protein assembly factor BamB